MPKKIDLTGQKFGKLNVLYEAIRKNKKQPIKWVCQCECGIIKEVRTSDLRNGHTRSCGKCLTAKKDITGQRFGKLVVLENVPSDMKGNAMWKCQCDCGKIIITKGNSLRSGNTTSCGCTRIEKLIKLNKERILDLTNQTFGELIAVEPTQKRDNNKSVIWKCKCSCGNEVYVSSHNLVNRNTQSCGCHNISLGESKIIKILKENNIKFEKQKQFDQMKFSNGYFAKFDFYLPDYNTIIEYDGRQHFIKGTGVYDNEEKFKKIQEHDKIKNEYCKQYNIILIRIPYTHFSNIKLEDLLPDTSAFII